VDGAGNAEENQGDGGGAGVAPPFLEDMFGKFDICPRCECLKPAELEFCVECSEHILRRKKKTKEELRYAEKYARWKEGKDKMTLLLSLLSPRVLLPIPYKHKATTWRDGSKYIQLSDGRWVNMRDILNPPKQKVLLPLEERCDFLGRRWKCPRGMRGANFREFDFAPGWGLIKTSDRGIMERRYALTYAKVWVLGPRQLWVKLIKEAL
jgi:ribosomal protein L40E